MKKLIEKTLKNIDVFCKISVFTSILLLLASEATNILSGYMCNPTVYMTRVFVIINFVMLFLAKKSTTTN